MINTKRFFILISTFILLVLSGNLRATDNNGLYVEYFDGTSLEKLVTSRTESKIDRFWNEVPPVEGVNPHECSIRWTGKLVPGRSGTYAFSARVDDGIRVWVGDQLIIDDWNLNDIGRFEGKVRLKANHSYDLKVEYFNALNEGEITLLWKIPPKEEKWYHRWFGGEFEVIGSEYFRLPSTIKKPSTQKEVVVSDKPASLRSKTSAPAPNKKTENKKTADSSQKVEKPVSPIAFSQPKEEVILDEKMVEKYVPKNIEFEHKQTNILEDSFHELNRFAKFMLNHDQLTVKIEGHTDAVGNEEVNKKLSERRAYAVAAYLVKQGVNAKRISAEGLGGAQPLVQPKPGEYHPANRRVEFIITGLEDVASNDHR